MLCLWAAQVCVNVGRPSEGEEVKSCESQKPGFASSLNRLAGRKKGLSEAYVIVLHFVGGKGLCGVEQQGLAWCALRYAVLSNTRQVSDCTGHISNAVDFVVNLRAAAATCAL